MTSIFEIFLASGFPRRMMVLSYPSFQVLFLGSHLNFYPYEDPNGRCQIE